MAFSPTSPARRSTALITGASNGIGFDLAHVFAEHGHDVILVARSEDKLRDLARDLAKRHGVTTTVMVADLRNPSAPDMLFKRTEDAGLAVDILVNNAGFGLNGRFDETDGDVEQDMIQVNIAALTALTKCFLRPMIARGHGRILNVASTAAFQPGPLMAVYYASKAYVLSFTEAVAEEVRKTGVTLTALCPGPTHTGFMDVAGLQRSNLFNSPVVMQSRPVAECGYEALMAGKRVAIPGVLNRLVALGNRFVTRRLSTRLSRIVQEKHR